MNLFGQQETKHRVFVSYHHDGDQYYRDHFEELFGHKTLGVFSSRSVQVGDIDPRTKPDLIRNTIRDDHIRGATVTVVLIGAETHKRRFVDWEIAASIRASKLNSRCGLLGIMLPTAPRGVEIPPRLFDNLKNGYATLHDWNYDSSAVRDWIHAAYERRSSHEPDQSRDLFKNNRP